MQGKLRPWFVGGILLGVAVISGAAGAALRGGLGRLRGEEPLIEGHLMWVHYTTTEGKSNAYSLTKYVPGGNGNHSIMLYARLYHDYVVLTDPQRDDWGPHIIPARNLVELEFTSAERAKQTMQQLQMSHDHPPQDHPLHDGHGHSDAGSSH